MTAVTVGSLPLLTREKNHNVDAVLWDEFERTLDLPERRLMWAVLQRAMFDYLARRGDHYRSAKRFFKDKRRDRHHIFSFYSIAEHLDPAGDADGFKARYRRYLARALETPQVQRNFRTVKL